METIILKGEKAILEGARLIQSGDVVVFPTETVYGLGANAFDEEAVKKIYLAKGRPSDNPLIVHISSKDQINSLVENINPYAQKLIDAFMPGPITIIMPKAKNIPSIVTGGLQTVGIRMPIHPVANSFIKACGCPIAAPSANVSTHISPTNAFDVYEDMQGRVKLIIDGGDCNVGIESTIVDTTSSIPTILRPGGVTAEMILSVLGCVQSFTGEVKVALAPGMKYRHYAPSSNMIIAQIDDIKTKYEEAKEKGYNPIIIAEQQLIDSLSNIKYISVGSTDDEIMRNIFASMRKADRVSDYIICQDFGSEGKRGSVMNRVKKAAGNGTNNN